MSLIRVAWYVSWVKNMHFGSPSDPSQTLTAEAKPRYVYSILKPHGQSFRRQVRLLLSQSRSQAVVCVSTPRMYLRSGYFLVNSILLYYSTLSIVSRYHQKADWKILQQNFFVETFGSISSIILLMNKLSAESWAYKNKWFIEEMHRKASTKIFCWRFFQSAFCW